MGFGLGVIGTIAGGAIGATFGGPAGAAVGAGIGGGIGTTLDASSAAAKASKQAANAQVASADAAIAEQRRQFDLMLEQLAPWREAGVNALATYQDALANPTEGFNAFTKTPAYTFPLAEGTQAVERSAAARGGLVSGRTGKELTRYGQGYASGQYQNYLNNFLPLITGGGSAATTTGSNALVTGANVGHLLLNQGNARASGYTNAAAARTQSVNRLASLGLLAAAIGFGNTPDTTTTTTTSPNVFAPASPYATPPGAFNPFYFSGQV